MDSSETELYCLVTNGNIISACEASKQIKYTSSCLQELYNPLGHCTLSPKDNFTML